MLGSQRNSSSNLLAQNKTTSKCAACGKTVYPMEKLAVLDKEYHKGCFKCDVCKMTLNLGNYKGVTTNGQLTIYCGVHYPKEKGSQVPDKQMQTAMTAPKLGKESGIQKDRRKTFVSANSAPNLVNNNNAAPKPAPATTSTTSSSTPATTNNQTATKPATAPATTSNSNNSNNNTAQTTQKDSKTEQSSWTAVKPTGAQSDQDKIEELKRQIEETKARLAIYEEENPDRKSETQAEDKKRIKKIFDMYDTDKSGSIDAYELQVLAYQLGETLTIDEVRELMKTIDTDGNGTIEFDEFFNWWTKQEDTSSTQSKASSANTVLRMKLQSKAYLRTIAHLGSKHSKNKNLKSKTKSDDDNLTKFSVDVSVGQVTNVQATTRFGFVTDAAQAAANREKFGAKSESSLFASFVLGVKPGIDDFKLGEISGVVKGLLYVLQEALGFDEYKTAVINENGRKQYVITIHVEEDERVAAIAEIVESLNIKTLEFNAEFGNLPSKGNDSPVFRGSFRLDAPRDAVEFLKELFDNDQDAAEEQNENSSSEKGESYFVQLLKKLMNVRVALSYVDLEEFMQKTLKSRGYDVAFPGWQGVPTLLKPFIKGTLNNPDLPGPVADFYFSLLQCFEGIDQIVAQIGDHIVQFDSKGFPLFSILPNKEVLDAEEPEPEEEEEDLFEDDEEDDNLFAW